MIELKMAGRELKLFRNSVLVFTLRPGDGAVEVGYGENSYKMDRGSFRIKEKIYVRKPLTVRKIHLSEDCAEITLSEGRAILSVDGNLLCVDFSGLSNYNRLWITLPADEKEHVYGTGETFTEFDLRGHKANIWVAEHQNAKMLSKKITKVTLGFKNGTRKNKFETYETYYAQPTFLSSRRYWFHSLTTARCEFDFSDKKYHHLKFDSIDSFRMGFGDSFEETMESLTSLLGRQPELPDWIYDGVILGIQGGTEIMMNKVRSCLEHGTNVAGVWIQDWEGRRVTAFGKQLQWNWEWDRELYPGLPDAIRELNEKNIKVLGYCNTFLAIEKPMYKEAAEKGYCVKDKNGKDYLVTITTFPAAIVDLTNPDARSWLKKKIKENMIDFGLSGWMADFGEYLPTDCVLYSGEDPELAHNTWPARWAKLNREVIEEAGKLGEIMFFTRAGFSETPKYSTMMWNGDNHVDFSIDNGMASVIPASLSLTCSGYGLSHSDIGGYTTFGKMCRSEELYMRWCEMNVFSPVMRSHEGNNPDLNAQFDASETTLVHQAKMSRIHTALKPYIKEAVRYNAEKGTGVIRPLFFHYDDEGSRTSAYEYMLGRDILVAPVLRPDSKWKKVFLPRDEWIEFSTGKEYGGGVFTVSCPLGSPVAFYRKNASPEALEIFTKAAKEYKNG